MNMDLLYPTDNEWGVPVLDAAMSASDLALPIRKWGTVARTRNAKQMPGLWHFYTDDYKFSGLWKNPQAVPNSGCAAAVEVNFSTNDQMPPAVALWSIYRKRWLARYWQTCGVRIFVDLLVAPRFRQLNLLGVPRGWRAYATRIDTDEWDLFLADYALAQEHAGSNAFIFLAYGGRETLGERVCSVGNNIVWVKDEALTARGG